MPSTLNSCNLGQPLPQHQERASTQGPQPWVNHGADVVHAAIEPHLWGRAFQLGSCRSLCSLGRGSCGAHALLGPLQAP